MFNAEKIVKKIADGVQEGENARRAAQFNDAVQTSEQIGQRVMAAEGARRAPQMVPVAVPVPVPVPYPVEVPVYYHVSHPVPVTLVQDQMGNVFYTPVRTAEMS